MIAINLPKATKFVSRLTVPLASERFLYLGTFATVVVAIATAIIAITFALRAGIEATQFHAAHTSSDISRDSWSSLDLGCVDKPLDMRRTARLFSANGVEKTGLHTLVAAVAPADQIETRSIPQQFATDAAPRGVPVPGSDRTEVRSPKNGKHARARIWREKSFTGAGRGFDAVH